MLHTHTHARTRAHTHTRTEWLSGKVIDLGNDVAGSSLTWGTVLFLSGRHYILPLVLVQHKKRPNIIDKILTGT